jgi:hypothetical protein
MIILLVHDYSVFSLVFRDDGVMMVFILKLSIHVVIYSYMPLKMYFINQKINNKLIIAN